MKVKELIEVLKQCPQDKNVLISTVINAEGISKAKDFEIGTDAYVIESSVLDVSDENIEDNYKDGVILFSEELNYIPNMSEL